MENKGVEMILKAKLDSEVAAWLDNQKAFREKGNVTSKAIEFYYDYLFNRKGFLVRLIDINFEDLKHLIRKVGSAKKNAQNLN